MREDDSYSVEEFQERKEEIDNKIAATTISVSESRIEQFDIEGALTYATHFISSLGRQWFDLPPNLRPKFQKLGISRGNYLQTRRGIWNSQVRAYLRAKSAF